ncbi:MAG: ABC transporter permease [Intrasporangium sp.]|uniref:ABC transporter permease n=1 Tax=Intrasporangium sp. TaxID=1925024 RepID=UPI0026492F8A|nr:ABC transporter permease [Intrasporangium sp.]MDN5796545.1 ABC transporter permease [Intrasporangium sp.]
MTAALLERRFLADYARTGTNLLLLVLVPVTFVIVAAPTLADAAKILGGARGGPGIETVTAGWAAAFLTGIAMYFQVASSRATDRRLVLAGLSRARLATARLLTGAGLAVAATAAALIALAARQGLADPVRIIAGTAMFAIVYLAIGAVVGALVPTPVNGTVLLLFVWILDVFFGPSLSGSTSPLLRVLPTHFISLWTVNQPPGHGGPSTLAWSGVWIVGALAAAYLVVAATPGRRPAAAPTRPAGQLRVGLRMGLNDWKRTPLLWLLLAAVPAVFILLSAAITPHGSSPVVVRELGVQITTIMDPAMIHPGTMAPEAIASLAALVGVFIVLDARAADRRLVLAGQRAFVAVATRVALVMLAAVVATVVSLAVTATVFTAEQWAVYGLGSLVIAITYGLIGMLLGPIFGRVSGVFMAFLLPFIDLGLGQSPMLGGDPADWALWMPGYGGMRVLIDGGLTASFDEGPILAVALAWIVVLAGAVVVLLRRTIRG